MARCIVSGCNMYKKNDTTPRGMLHLLPQTSSQIKRWLLQTGEDYGDIDKFVEHVKAKRTYYRMCAWHFTCDSYYMCGTLKRLKSDAIPTIFRKTSSENSSGKDQACGSGTVNLPQTPPKKDDTCIPQQIVKHPQHMTDCLLMTNDEKKMTEQILTHTLEIIILLTGKVSLVQQLTNSLKISEMSNDKTMTEKILHHAEEIINLLTREVNNVSRPHGPTVQGLHSFSLIPQYPITNYTVHQTYRPKGGKHQPSQSEDSTVSTGHKEIGVDKVLHTCQFPSHVSPGDVNTVNVQSDEQIEELSVRCQMEDQQGIQENTGSGRHDENLYPELINKEGEYETEENDIEQMEIQSHQCTDSEKVTTSIISKRDQQEETNVSSHQQIKKEEIHINISEGLHNENLDTVLAIKEEEDEMDERDILQVTIQSDLCAGPSSWTSAEQEKELVAKKHQELEEEIPINISDGVGQHSRSSRSVHWVTGEIGSTDVHREAVVYIKKPIKETTKTSGNGNILAIKNKSTEHLDGSVSYNVQSLSHQNIPTGDKPFACSECERCFSEKRALVSHEKVHKGDKPFACSDCGKGFVNKTFLVKHQRIHTGEKPFACSECGKCFGKKTILVTHEKIHASEKSFACSECGKCFSQKSNLDKHQRTHTGEKPFKCSECGKCFSQKYTLVTHEMLHANVKPFECSKCGKCFSQKSHLVIHERTHTGEKPFACSVCGKCFSDHSARAKHQKLKICKQI
ncbi:uncharacterized protein O3C94_016676 [Discoglossus pictus]